MRLHLANMLANRQWTPKQALALACTTLYLAIDGGRRFGKSYVAAACVAKRAAIRHSELMRQVRHGERKPWVGAGMKPKVARHMPPDVDVVCLTPMAKHQEQCRSYIMSYFNGTRARFIHPGIGLSDGGKQFWLYYGGVTTRFRFVTASSVSAVVGTSIDILWIDEAGLMAEMIVRPALPLLWEKNGELICSGTPELGVEHWFSTMCVRGLPKDHPRAMPDAITPDPDYTTIIGSSYEAFDPLVRKRAEADAALLGSAWEAQWILGDWRLPDLYVYDEWREQDHVVDYDHETHTLAGRTLRPPDKIIGVKDFAYSTTNPGGAVVYHVWMQNPLDTEDKVRPLVIAVADIQKAQEYTQEGWWGDLQEMTDDYKVQVWYVDPSREELVRAIRRTGKLGVPVLKGSKKDKSGRIVLVRALLHVGTRVTPYGDPVRTLPAFFVTRNCRHLRREFPKYRYATNAKGEVQNAPIDDDDHVLDCCAFLVSKIMLGGRVRLTLPV